MHSVEEWTYAIDTPKETIFQEASEYASRNGDAGGLYGGFSVKSKICESYDEAVEYANSIDNSYANFMFKYKEHKDSAKTKRLETTIKELEKKRRALKEYFAKEKRAYKTCPKCGSKLSTTYLNRNVCPLCKEDLRPLSVKNKEIEIENKISAKKKELKEAKANNPYVLKWFVKFEFHC